MSNYICGCAKIFIFLKTKMTSLFLRYLTHEKCPLIIQNLTDYIQLQSRHCWRSHDTVERTACQHGAMVRRLRLKRVGDPLAGGLPLPLPEAEGLPGEAEGLPGEAEGEGGARLTALPLAADVDRGAGTQGGGGQHAEQWHAGRRCNVKGTVA
jgi:hypothetical protein